MRAEIFWTYQLTDFNLLFDGICTISTKFKLNQAILFPFSRVPAKYLISLREQPWHQFNTVIAL